MRRIAFGDDIPPDALDAVKNVELTLLDMPGVNGIGLGIRESEGELFPDELAVRILVDDASEVPEEVPTEIAGIDVCIIQGRYEPFVSPDTTRYRDLHGGIQITNPGLSDAGTLGAIVQDTSATGSGRMLGLSCFHVVGESGATFPDIVWQPRSPAAHVVGAPPPPRRGDNLGEVQRASFPNDPAFLEIGLNSRVGSVDAAVFTLDEALNQQDPRDRRTISRSIMGQDEQQPNLADAITDTAFPVIGMDVSKRGAMTRVTHGRVVGMARSLKWQFLQPPPSRWISGSWEILVDRALTPDGVFCLAGDSGSVVLLREGERVLPTAVGLLWGGLIRIGPNGESVPDGQFGCMIPIQVIEDELEISIVFA
jgi:hypothetical protein